LGREISCSQWEGSKHALKVPCLHFRNIGGVFINKILRSFDDLYQRPISPGLKNSARQCSELNLHATDEEKTHRAWHKIWQKKAKDLQVNKPTKTHIAQNVVRKCKI
jgi:hypothetical protein